MRNPRWTQIGLLILLAVCFAQVGWWIFDQVRSTRQSEQRLLELYRADQQAADRLLEQGLSPDSILDLYPHLDRSPDDAGFTVASTARESLREEGFRRLNRYGWEGGFFLVVLAAVMLVIGRVLREEHRLHERQQKFLAVASHELKTPLASLKLTLDTLALRDTDEERRQELVARMKVDLERWQNQISNILDATVLETGNSRPERVPLPLVQAVEPTADELLPLAEASGVRLRVVGARDLVVVADPYALRAVVRNLLNNAIDSASRADGGTVTLMMAGADGMAEIEVRDDGTGFEPKDAERLFEKFYRPDDDRLAAGRGSGLGLYLVKRLVEAGGGQVSAESSGPGGGATFRVRWPLSTEEPS